jgi:hypothetical protein
MISAYGNVTLWSCRINGETGGGLCSWTPGKLAVMRLSVVAITAGVELDGRNHTQRFGLLGRT